MSSRVHVLLPFCSAILRFWPVIFVFVVYGAQIAFAQQGIASVFGVGRKMVGEAPAKWVLTFSLQVSTFYQ